MRCLYKYILGRIGIKITNFQDTVNTPNTMVVAIQAKSNWLSATAETTFVSFALIPGTHSANVAVLTNAWDIYCAANNNVDQFHFTHVVVSDGVSIRREFDISDAVIHFDIKSTMKVQNTTHEATDGAQPESDDVNRVPINGKIYQGYGSGTGSNRDARTEAQLVSNSYATISYDPGSSGVSASTSLQKPPPAGYFHNVTKMGKITFNPGDIKTSVLHTRKSLKIARLAGLLDSSLSTPSQQVLKFFGHFRFYALEHVIKASHVSLAWPDIEVRGEVDWTGTAHITNKVATVTDPTFSWADQNIA